MRAAIGQKGKGRGLGADTGAPTRESRARRIRAPPRQIYGPDNNAIPCLCTNLLSVRLRSRCCQAAREHGSSPRETVVSAQTRPKTRSGPTGNTRCSRARPLDAPGAWDGRTRFAPRAVKQSGPRVSKHWASLAGRQPRAITGAKLSRRRGFVPDIPFQFLSPPSSPAPCHNIRLVSSRSLVKQMPYPVPPWLVAHTKLGASAMQVMPVRASPACPAARVQETYL